LAPAPVDISSAKFWKGQQSQDGGGNESQYKRRPATTAPKSAEETLLDFDIFSHAT